jgi:hypothetical protein
MGLGNVTGVFSRYFVVGFLLPVFVALVTYSQSVTTQLLPTVYEKQSPATQIAILGGLAIPIALAMLGLNYPITRAFEGYPLLKLAKWLIALDRGRACRFVGSGIDRAMKMLIDIQANRREKLRALRDTSLEVGAVAAWRLDCRYPRRRQELLPTSFGNVIRAFELHSRHRWGLDAIAVQPRINALLSDNEREIEADARSETAFFVNLSLLSIILAVACTVDLVAYRSGRWYQIVALSIPLFSAWAFYHASIGAAERWGSAVRSAIDLHRFELYTKIGIIQPTTFTEERTLTGPAISKCFLHGTRLPDELRDGSKPTLEDEK